ncbi:dimethylamine monooxygenase subunit DmmA family protein [uncultured Nocardioides sp.]|uniref:dimethylamine monooxygenase subunit DmmA family protein n=1 Tax=uncultured Nocardioides sp. TaxID=198441 RepID=UPI002639585E|nr:dimethylamine monooxygenase subunit DmmA family protein [uncultured Nocardioides sp.]
MPDGGTAPALGLPWWPSAPEPVDPAAAGVLVLALGVDPRVAEVATAWADEAERVAPTRVVTVPEGIDGGAATVSAALTTARTGVRILVVGAQYDVLRGLALARGLGAGPRELSAYAVDAGAARADLPVFCAHCRAVRRLHTTPGGTVDCTGCGRHLEVHGHHSASLGAFLTSDSRARELV